MGLWNYGKLRWGGGAGGGRVDKAFVKSSVGLFATLKDVGQLFTEFRVYSPLK